MGVVGRPFRKGQSGNPGGRPKGKTSGNALVRELLEEIIEYEQVIKGKKTKLKGTAYEIMIRRLRQEALNGDHWAFRELANRGYGMPRQSMEVTGAQGGGVSIIVTEAAAGGNGNGNGIKVITDGE